MGQYSSGAALVTNGSAVVAGVSTFWTKNIVAGNWFEILGEGVWYDVLSVDSDTQITLKTAYVGTTKAGTSGAGVGYAIQRDFTQYNGYPIPAYGDQDTASLLSYALQRVDLQLSQIQPNLTGLSNGSLTVTGQLAIAGGNFSLGSGAFNFDALSTSGAFITAASLNTGTTPFAGLKVERGANDAYLIWNESSQRWGCYLAPDGSALADIEASNIYTNVASPSDARFKTVHGRIEGALDLVQRLAGMRFDWNEEAERRGIAHKGPDVGLIAQDVEGVLPEAVTMLGDTRYVSHHRIVPVLIEAVKELAAQVEALRLQLLSDTPVPRVG